MLLLVRIVLYGFVGMVGLVCAANIANTVTTSVALRRREFAMLRSAGMGPAEMQRMVALESVVYACSALAWGLPIGLGVVFLAWRKIGTARLVPFSLPWAGLAAAIFGVLALTRADRAAAVRRLRKMNLARICGENRRNTGALQSRDLQRAPTNRGNPIANPQELATIQNHA